jgi:predicted Na+-dependent transporter
MRAALGRHFYIPAYASLVLGFTVPGDFHDGAWGAFWRTLVPLSLGGILYFTCLRLGLGELRAGIDRRLALRVAGIVPVRLIVLPLLAWALTRGLAPPWAAGVALVCMMPAGFTSVAFTDLYGGRRVLALAVVLATSACCPLTVPPLLDALGAPEAAGGASRAVVLAGRALWLLGLLAAPFAAAQATRALVPGFIARHHHRWGRGAILSTCALIFVSVVCNRHGWASWAWADMLLPLGLACLGCALAALMSIGALRVMARADAIAFASGAIYVNNGLGIAFAVSFFPGDPRMVLPGVLMQVPIVGGMALFGALAGRAHAPAGAAGIGGGGR